MEVALVDHPGLPSTLNWVAVRVYYPPIMEPSIIGLGFRGLGFRVYYPPIMENQMEKKMENEMETGGNIGI